MKRNASFIVLFIIFIIGITIGISPYSSHASTRRYYVNFDSKTIPQPFIGKIGLYQNFSEYNIQSPRYFFSTGRGGTGYSLTDNTAMFGGKSDWRSTSLYWEFYNTWPTDELYVSWWERYIEPMSPAFQNTKLFYLWFDSDDSSMRNRLSMERTYDEKSTYFARGAYLDKNGNYMAPDGESGWYAALPGMTNGQWHHFELYVNFKGYTTKLWYDGVLQINKTFDPSLINWTRHISWMQIFGGWTGCCPQVTNEFNFTRQIDDFEVWDGIPIDRPSGFNGGDGGGSLKTPSPPFKLFIE